MGPLGYGATTDPMESTEPVLALESTAQTESAETGPDYALARVDWLEPVVLTTDTPSFALVTGRAVKMRAFVTAPQAGAPAPQVHVRVLDSQQVLSDSVMEPPTPAIVGTQPELGSLSAAYLFQLRAEWVKPGLQVELTVESGPDGTDPDLTNNHLVLRPTVDPAHVLYLTVVPVRTQMEGLASLPEEANGPEATRQALKSLLMATFPLSDVKIRIHAPYDAHVTTQYNNWGYLLGEIDNLSFSEGSHGYYLGFIKPSGGSTVGNSFMPGTVAIVASGDPWLKGTVRHELGHNFFRSHAYCGPLDASGQNWGYNAEKNQMIDPTLTNDDMSYCGPSWVSRANYLGILKQLKVYGLDKPKDISDWK